MSSVVQHEDARFTKVETWIQPQFHKADTHKEQERGIDYRLTSSATAEMQDRIVHVESATRFTKSTLCSLIKLVPR